MVYVKFYIKFNQPQISKDYSLYLEASGLCLSFSKSKSSSFQGAHLFPRL